MRHATWLLVACLPFVACSDDTEPGSGSSSATGGSGGTGGAVGGGGNNGGGGAGGAPECVDHSDCTAAGSAQCDGGTCVPCSDNLHCEGVPDAGVCDSGTCVECLLGQEDACSGSETCDLLAQSCVEVAPGSVLNCNACSNDLQREAGHRCIEMEFQSAPHGYYCLEEVTGSCARPFQVPINKASISGAAAVNYCGIEEDNATCEAVLALLQGWLCPSNTDGMCSPDGIAPEQPVPGAICEQVGVGGDACTYACDSTPQCPSGAPQDTCGPGTNIPPGWCGG